MVCLDQSIYDVVKTVGLGYEKNGLKSIGISRSAGRRAIKAVTKGKLPFLDSNGHIVLPVFGQIAMQVHRGYKVFDFDRLEVSKVFGQDVSTQDATKEIAASKQVSDIAAAPKYLIADPDLAWFKEEYICGTHATDIVAGPASDYIGLYPDVEKCLLDLVASKSPTKTTTHTHIEHLANTSFRTRWLNARLAAKDVDEIAAYAEQLRHWLLSRPKHDQLQLVLTHGDFSLVNAIATDTGLRFVDWEGIAPGGLYSDILNFLFVERYYGRASVDFRNEVSVFLGRFREAIISRFPELEGAAALDPTIARRLYYLERLNVLLNRSASGNLCDVVRKSISMFRDFDNEMGDVAD